MKRALVVFLLMVAATATAQTTPSVDVLVMPQPDGSVVFVLPPAAVQHCMENGGCRIVTGAGLQAFAADMKKSCGERPSI